MSEINWYPGHMAKTRRMLGEQIRAVDAVIELCDARAPMATRNPDLDALARGKVRLLVLNKADLADDGATKRWLEFFRASGAHVVRLNSAGGNTRDIKAAIQKASEPSVERMRARGANKTVRMMVIGIPNVGKSTFINRLFGSSIARASDRPGVTRARQWVKIGPYLELMDTPGMLWPKLDDQEAARLLAYIGSVRDQVIDQEALAESLLQLLMNIAPGKTVERYRLAGAPEGLSLLEAACAGRGWIMSGGRHDTARGAALVLDEFRDGRVGRITLEQP